jgi:hypothetical protein
MMGQYIDKAGSFGFAVGHRRGAGRREIAKSKNHRSLTHPGW